MSEPLVELRQLHKSFGDNHVLRGIDLTVAKGEVLCIIGPSGSGKSTLLRCVNLLEQPTGGQVFVAGVELTHRDCDIDKARRATGMVFQQFNLFSHLSVRENVTISLRKVLKMKRDEANARADALLDRVGLADKASAYPAQLSGGQQQRVAIARAVIKGAPILIFDEATSALDNNSEAAVQAAIDALRIGRTTLIVAHRLTTIRTADQIVVVDRGEIVQVGNHDQLMLESGLYLSLYNELSAKEKSGYVQNGTDPT